MDTKDTRKRSRASVSTEVFGRGPLTRSRKALLNKAAEEHGVNPDLNGSHDEELRTHNSYSYPGTSGNERGDGTHVGAQKSCENAVVNEDPEITSNSGSSSVLPKKGSSAERPDVIGKLVPDLRSRKLVRPTIRSRQTAHPENEESTTTCSRNKRCTKSSSRSFTWSVTSWILLLSSTAALSFLVPSVLWFSDYGKIHLSRPVKVEEFHKLFTTLESSFPHQRDPLWRWSKIHLENHLKTQDPTEPVSLILAAGRGAENTLRCLALSFASSFSSAHNGSVLSIDGAGQAGYDGDQVKLYIDKQLQAAFEGETPAVVIHRLEELPPSSTLIFYRYCDHENAAYKKVLLLFTVLLPQDEIPSDKSLKEVEELVQDHLMQKLVDSNNAGFNKMDANKFSGLWSRISHLILPVVSEGPMEKKGCELQTDAVIFASKAG